MHTPQKVRRGPNSYHADLLRITIGCSYGKCHFCNIFGKENNYSLVPMEHIIEDLDEIAATRRNPLALILQEDDPLGLPNDKLLPILDLIHQKLPTVKQITGFMCVSDVKRKTDQELRELADAGITSAIFGVESGWDETLERIEKGQTAQDVIENLPRLEEVGIKYSTFYMCGLAGAGKCEENALRSAEVYSKLNPTTITMVSTTPFKGTLLRKEVEDGTFVLAPESEVILEAATFIENLECETFISGEQDSNLFKIEGFTPQHREKMVKTLRWRADNVDDEKLAGLRLLMKNM